MLTVGAGGSHRWCFEPLDLSVWEGFGGGGISMLRRLWTLRDLEARLCDLEERPV